MSLNGGGNSHFGGDPQTKLTYAYVPTFALERGQTALIPQPSSASVLDDSHCVENSFPLAQPSTCGPQGQFQAQSTSIRRPTEHDGVEPSLSSEERKANAFLDDGVEAKFSGETQDAVKDPNPKPFESSAERNDKNDTIENKDINSPHVGSDSNPKPKSSSLVPPTFQRSLSCPIDKNIAFRPNLPKTEPECSSKLQAAPELHRTTSCPGSGEDTEDANVPVVREVSDDHGPDNAVLPDGPSGIQGDLIKGTLHARTKGMPVLLGVVLVQVYMKMFPS